MKITYDPSCNMGYIYFVYPFPNGASRKKNGGMTKEVNFSGKPNHTDLIIDIDRDGRILGIELFNATKQLSKKLLESAEVLFVEDDKRRSLQDLLDEKEG